MPSVRSKSKEKGKEKETSKLTQVRRAHDAGEDKICSAFAEEGGSSLKAAQQVSVGGGGSAISKTSPNSVRGEVGSSISVGSVTPNTQRGIGVGGISGEEPIRADIDPHELFRSPKTFRKEVRARFMGVLKSILSDHDRSWRVMVLDERATRVVSSIVGMYDVMEVARITCVENLFLTRQPFTEMEAIYVLAPCKESIRQTIKDFKGGKKGQLYSAAHFIFLGSVDEDMMTEIRQAPNLLGMLKSFKEINLDFLVAETQVFHLDMGTSTQGIDVDNRGVGDFYRKLYNIGKADNDSCMTIMSQVAQRLVTLCCTMNEYPYVRFSKNHSGPGIVAQKFQEEMNTFMAGVGQKWSFNGQDASSSRGRATLLILDRLDDLLSPLMHEFTYQSLAQDVLHIVDGRIVYEAETQGGNVETKEVVLNENNDLWVEYRHAHIGLVLREVSSHYNDLIKNFKGASELAQGKGGSMSLEEMRQATQGLPEFQELSKQISQHVKLAGMCSNKVSELKLLDIGSMEQALAIGTTEAGKKCGLQEIRDGWVTDGQKCEGLVELLTSSTTSTEMKLRLLGVLTLTRKDMSEKDRMNLVNSAQLSPDEMKLLNALADLDINVVSENAEASAKKSRFKGFNLSSLRGSRGGGSGNASDAEFSHMRYTPPLKEALEKLIRGQDHLPLEDFPSVQPLPEGVTESPAVGSRSSRGHKSCPGSPCKSKNNNTTEFIGPRIIVFVLGGITFSEIRVAYELMIQTKREIILGSTSLLTPPNFIASLSSLV